eukprot:gnl/Hemi2/7777_TR2686_c0_g1_i1.p1 gnl/Hemi2/7777_TR2686_c0_g1~~gnl/Hemi2/7777_TR2686_c0_g1_i1.p1  ORF type:complete len:324 (+),score=131.46 gnl/Hemi2/7777_TR2686_c0_g1_i1:51-1022(+)
MSGPRYVPPSFGSRVFSQTVSSINKSFILRERIQRPGVIQLPGTYDCLSAMAAEKAGAEALYTSGLSISAALLGMPDTGLMGMTENLDQIRRIAQAVSIPIVADVDTGYGSATNVHRLVRDLIRAGIAGACIEDQVWPKKCGHFEGKMVIPAEEYVVKLRAAVEARGDSGFVIFSRTDARGPLGLDEAIRRACLYRDNGADVVFVEAPQSKEELQRIRREVADVPLLFNFLEGGRQPIRTVKELEELGFNFAMYSNSGILGAMKAYQEVYGEILQKGSSLGVADKMGDFKDLLDLVHLDKEMEKERNFRSGFESRARQDSIHN